MTAMTERPPVAPLGPSAPAPALLVTEDPELVAEVQRCAAGTGVALEVRGWGPDAAQRWGRACLVLVGSDAAPAVQSARLRRRDEVHLLCRAAPEADDYRRAVALGAQGVTGLDGSRHGVSELLQERASPSAGGRVVGVVAGSGGAGASTLVAALAAGAVRRGHRSLVLDCDPLGAGVARILGADELTGLGWPDLLASPGRVGPVSLAEAVPRIEDVGVLAGGVVPPPADVALDVAETGRRVHDLVLLDVPRGGTATADLVARTDLALLVVRPDLGGVAGAARQLEAWRAGGRGAEPGTGHVGVVLRGRGPAPSVVASSLGVPVVARLPDDRRVGQDVDLGLGPVPRRRGGWARAVESLLDVVGVAVRP